LRTGFTCSAAGIPTGRVWLEQTSALEVCHLPKGIFGKPGLAQTAACCSLRSRRDLDFEIIEIEITRNADTEPRVCASHELFERQEQYAGKMIKVRAGTAGAQLWISNAIFGGPVKTCSAWLDIVVLFPWQVTPHPDFDVVRDASFAKFKDAINTGKTRIDATYEGRFEILHVVRDGKRINVMTGKEEPKRRGKRGWYDARIVLHQVSDVDAMRLPRK